MQHDGDVFEVNLHGDGGLQPKMDQEPLHNGTLRHRAAVGEYGHGEPDPRDSCRHGRVLGVRFFQTMYQLFGIWHNLGPYGLRSSKML